MTNHLDFYARAQHYDIAFDFKNVTEENQTILDVYRRYRGQAATSFLDIAAGPATNAIEMAGRGLNAWALDYSEDMVSYGQTKAKTAGVELNYIQGDMRMFELPQTLDLAAIFMDSTSYLLTNEDMLSHLRSVARVLNPGGLYVLEMSHPRDVFSVGKSASTQWEMSRDNIKVSIQWGEAGDTFDPIRQITNVTARLKFQTPNGAGEIVDRSEQRCYTTTEFAALVQASGQFEIIEILGSLKPGVTFSNDKTSWRMVPVLRKL